MPASTQNISQHVLNISSDACEYIKYTSTFVDHTYHMTARTQHISQFVLTKLLPWQRGHKMYLNMCWINPTNASENTKCITKWVDQFPPIPARIQNASQHVLTKPLPCQRGNKRVSPWVDQTRPMPARTQIAFQHVLTKPITSQRGHKMHLIICCQTPPMPASSQNESQLVFTKSLKFQRRHKMHVLTKLRYASEDTKWNSPCVEETRPMPSRT